MYIDSHCHLDKLDLSEFGNNLDNVISHARDKGVNHFLCVSVTLDEFPLMQQKMAAYADVSLSCGVHPLHHECSYQYEQLLTLADHPKVVAIGETGLDYYYSKDTLAWQQASFIQHCQVAKQLQKPLIIHTRDARQDTLSILKNESAESVGGVLHCFTESLEMAKAAIEMNFMISISGIVTFGNATELRDVVRALPVETLLIETDSPWLAPKPYRGKQNQPAYVAQVAQYVADLKGITTAELASITSDNFKRLFKTAAV